jgi:hypothetical protein
MTPRTGSRVRRGRSHVFNVALAVGITALVLVATACTRPATTPMQDATSPPGTLNSVSCVTSHWCIATGYAVRGVTAPAIERWNGRTWFAMKAPVMREGVLNGVSCAKIGMCVAVGELTSVDRSSMLVESLKGGTWVIIAVRSPGGQIGLNSVSCASPTACVAVGWQGVDQSERPLIESFDGRAWTRVAVGASGMSALQSVTCPTQGWCTASGWSNTSRTDGMLTGVVSRFGQAFIKQTTPPESARLTGVSCPSVGTCTSVGSAGPPGFSNHVKAVVLGSLNRSAWTVVASFSGKGTASLNAVSCATQGSCVAVGATLRAPARPQPAVAQLRTGSWRFGVAAPTLNGAILKGISCSSSDWCMAVGQQFQRHTTPLTLAEVLIRGKWTIAPTR